MTPDDYIELLLHQLVIEINLGYDEDTVLQAQSSIIVIQDSARYLISRGRKLNDTVKGFCETYDLVHSE